MIDTTKLDTAAGDFITTVSRIPLPEAVNQMKSLWLAVRNHVNGPKPQATAPKVREHLKEQLTCLGALGLGSSNPDKPLSEEVWQTYRKELETFQHAAHAILLDKEARENMINLLQLTTAANKFIDTLTKAKAGLPPKAIEDLLSIWVVVGEHANAAAPKTPTKDIREQLVHQTEGIRQTCAEEFSTGQDAELWTEVRDRLGAFELAALTVLDTKEAQLTPPIDSDVVMPTDMDVAANNFITHAEALALSDTILTNFSNLREIIQKDLQEPQEDRDAFCQHVEGELNEIKSMISTALPLGEQKRDLGMLIHELLEFAQLAHKEFTKPPATEEVKAPAPAPSRDTSLDFLSQVSGAARRNAMIKAPAPARDTIEYLSEVANRFISTAERLDTNKMREGLSCFADLWEYCHLHLRSAPDARPTDVQEVQEAELSKVMVALLSAEKEHPDKQLFGLLHHALTEFEEVLLAILEKDQYVKPPSVGAASGEGNAEKQEQDLAPGESLFKVATTFMSLAEELKLPEALDNFANLWAHAHFHIQPGPVPRKGDFREVQDQRRDTVKVALLGAADRIQATQLGSLLHLLEEFGETVDAILEKEQDPSVGAALAEARDILHGAPEMEAILHTSPKVLQRRSIAFKAAFDAFERCCTEHNLPVALIHARWLNEWVHDGYAADPSHPDAPPHELVQQTIVKMTHAVQVMYQNVTCDIYVAFVAFKKEVENLLPPEARSQLILAASDKGILFRGFCAGHAASRAVEFVTWLDLWLEQGALTKPEGEYSAACIRGIMQRMTEAVIENDSENEPVAGIHISLVAFKKALEALLPPEKKEPLPLPKMCQTQEILCAHNAGVLFQQYCTKHGVEDSRRYAKWLLAWLDSGELLIGADGFADGVRDLIELMTQGVMQNNKDENCDIYIILATFKKALEALLPTTPRELVQVNHPELAAWSLKFINWADKVPLPDASEDMRNLRNSIADALAARVPPDGLASTRVFLVRSVSALYKIVHHTKQTITDSQLCELYSSLLAYYRAACLLLNISMDSDLVGVLIHLQEEARMANEDSEMTTPQEPPALDLDTFEGAYLKLRGELEDRSFHLAADEVVWLHKTLQRFDASSHPTDENLKAYVDKIESCITEEGEVDTALTIVLAHFTRMLHVEVHERRARAEREKKPSISGLTLDKTDGTQPYINPIHYAAEKIAAKADAEKQDRSKTLVDACADFLALYKIHVPETIPFMSSITIWLTNEVNSCDLHSGHTTASSMHQLVDKYNEFTRMLIKDRIVDQETHQSITAAWDRLCGALHNTIDDAHERPAMNIEFIPPAQEKAQVLDPWEVVADNFSTFTHATAGWPVDETINLLGKIIHYAKVDKALPHHVEICISAIRMLLLPFEEKTGIDGEVPGKWKVPLDRIEQELYLKLDQVIADDEPDPLDELSSKFGAVLRTFLELRKACLVDIELSPALFEALDQWRYVVLLWTGKINNTEGYLQDPAFCVSLGSCKAQAIALLEKLHDNDPDVCAAVRCLSRELMWCLTQDEPTPELHETTKLRAQLPDPAPHEEVMQDNVNAVNKAFTFLHEVAESNGTLRKPVHLIECCIIDLRNVFVNSNGGMNNLRHLGHVKPAGFFMHIGQSLARADAQIREKCPKKDGPINRTLRDLMRSLAAILNNYESDSFGTPDA